MANLNQPAGFRPVQTRSGSPWTGKCMRVAFVASDATAAFVGSLVTYTGESIDGGRTPVVTLAAPASDRLAGAVVRFEYNPEAMGTLYRPASTLRYAWIPADRDVMYWVQEDGDTTPLTAGAVEANIDFTAESGDTATGNSTMELDSDTVGVAATLPLRVVKADFGEDNELGQWAKWLVTLNLDAYSDKDGI